MYTNTIYLKSLIAMFSKGLAAIFALLFNIVIVSLYPNKTAATAMLVITLTIILSVLIRIGCDQLVVRVVGRKGVITSATKKILQTFNTAILLNWLFISIVGTFLIIFLDIITYYQYMLVCISLLCYSLFQVNSYIFQGKNKIFLHIVFLNLFLFAIASSIHLIMYFAEKDFTLNLFLEIFALSNIMSYVVSSIILKIGFTKLNFSSRYLYIFKINLPYCLFSFIQICLIWMPQVFLYISDYRDEVPSYTIMHRFSLLVGFALISISAVFTPRFAAAIRRNNLTQISKDCSIFVKMATSAAIGVSIFLWFTIDVILGVMNKGILLNRELLLILFCAEIVNCLTGPALKILQMKGELKDARKVQFIAFSFQLLVSFFLISKYGIIGAGVVVAFNTIFCNVAYGIIVKKRLNLDIYNFRN